MPYTFGVEHRKLGPMIYAETPRMHLRSLQESDLPRLAELIGDWDVARWLPTVPYPYTLSDAEVFYRRMRQAHDSGMPEYFLLEDKESTEQLGAIGLHPPRVNPAPGKLVIGYWLGKQHWGRGLMSEGLVSVLKIAFARTTTECLTAETDPGNVASQNVLRKTGFTYLGLAPYRDPDALRAAGQDSTCWSLIRGDYLK